MNSQDAMDRAKELMRNVYRLGVHPAVTLPADLSWTEDPLHDSNWQFQLHSMRFVLDLFTASRLSGNQTYRSHALGLMLDWVQDNPRYGARSPWAWNDHSTALRAVVLACAVDMGASSTWLRDALVLHGRTLADPTFYRKEGNHALNQAIGLLEVGRVLRRSDWVSLAADRMRDLVGRSVDAEGVTNEQSVGYQRYNYTRYTQARQRLLAVGVPPGSAFNRVDLMPGFLAHATLPFGRYEMIGDTAGAKAIAIRGTEAEYAATSGASGPKPTKVISRYAAGYLFVRSGWGERRAAKDETFFATKWGLGPRFHGHADGMELTLAGYGARLLLDPGMYSYTASAYRNFFKQRTAHNVVTVDGMTWPFTTPTKLVDYRISTKYVDLRIRATGYSGVTQTRRITYSRRLDVVLVEDRMASTSVHTYRQLWHFSEDARPAVGVTSVWTQRTRGNVLVRQLAGRPALRIVRGQTSPVQGWVSYEYNKKLAAAVEEAALRGSNVRFLTLIVPAAGKPGASVSGLRLTSSGYTVTIAANGHSERITVSGPSIWITSLS